MYIIYYEYIFIWTDDIPATFQKYFLNVWKSLFNNTVFVFFANKIFSLSNTTEKTKN